MNTRAIAALRTEPTGLQRQAAAAHCGISPGHFDAMVRDGVLPVPRLLGGVKIWLRQELDAALYAVGNQVSEGGTSCDEAFGLNT